MPARKIETVYKYRIVFFWCLSTSYIHATIQTDIPKDQDACQGRTLSEESPGSGLFLGNWPRRPVAKNMHRSRDLNRKVDKLIETTILFFIIFQQSL